MRQTSSDERARSWVVDYSAARARAIEWLGERYLLARPINRKSGTGRAGAEHREASGPERS